MNTSVNYSVKIANNLITDSIEIMKAKAVANELDDKVKALKTEFLELNLSSATSAWLLSDMMIRSQITNENAAAAFGKMDKAKWVAIPFYNEVAKRVDGFTATGVGKMVPEINSLNTFNGKRFNLSFFKRKICDLRLLGYLVRTMHFRYA